MKKLLPSMTHHSEEQSQSTETQRQKGTYWSSARQIPMPTWNHFFRKLIYLKIIKIKGILKPVVCSLGKKLHWLNVLHFIFLEVAATSDSSDPYITKVSMVLKVYHALISKDACGKKITETKPNKYKNKQTNKKQVCFSPFYWWVRDKRHFKLCLESHRKTGRVKKRTFF